MKNFYPAIFILACLTSGCMEADNNGMLCTTEADPGIELMILDAQTHAPITETLTVRLVEETYEEKMVQAVNKNNYTGAFERAGNYTLIIESEEYASWFKSDLIVKEVPCGVETIRLTAFLNKN